MFEPTQNSSANDKGAEVKGFSQLFSIKQIGEELDKLASSNSFDAILNFVGSMDVGTMSIAKNFGLTREQADKMKDSLLASRDEVFALGGSWDDILKTQKEAGAALGRNVTLSIEGQRELFAAAKVSEKGVGDLTKAFKSVGFSIYEVGDQMAKVVRAAQETGVNARATSDMVVTNLGAMNKFNFKDGVEGLARMAAESVALRINMNDVLAVSEKAFNPESAIKMAAELQRLGVQQSALLDPLSLMNLAENDPEELQKQLANMSKQFVKLNEDGQFEILPGAKRQMRAIEESLGMTKGALYNMAIASAETDEKMKKIKFPDFATEEQKKLIANITEMGKGGEMKITVDGKQMGIDEALRSVGNKDELQKLIGLTEEKSIEDLAVDQLDMLESINIGIGMLNGIIPAAFAKTSIGKAAPKVVGEKFREGGIGAVKAVGGTTNITETFEGMLDSIKKTAGGKFELKDISDGFKKIKESEAYKNIDSVIKTLEKNLRVVSESLKANNVSFDKLLDAAEKFESGVKVFVNKINPSKDLIISPKAGNFQTLEEDEIVAGTGITDMLGKIKEIKNTIGVDSSNLISKMSVPNVSKETVKGESKGPEKITFDLNINITAPSQVDTEEVKKLFKDPLVLQPLMSKMEEVASNFNLGKKV